MAFEQDSLSAVRAARNVEGNSLRAEKVLPRSDVGRDLEGPKYR